MHLKSFTLLLCVLLLNADHIFCQDQSKTKNDWKLVWRDEFNGTKLDTGKWNVLIRENSKHNELQYYVPDEVFVDNGVLKIRSRKRNYGSKEYTSGRLDTDGKFAPVYGRFEIRAKLPGGHGLWPAHWLYPQDRDWLMEKTMEDAVAAGKERLIPEDRPWYSEIDIMEFLGHEVNTLYGTIHYCSYDGTRRSSSGTWKSNIDYTKDFHIYVLEWEPDSIRWYIDGNLIYGTTSGIPHKPHYLILNTAVGGSWPGNPDSTTVFPQYHEIDYVRIYRKSHIFESRMREVLSKYECPELSAPGTHPHFKQNPMEKTKIFIMPFSSVYPLYIQKAEKKGRTKAEVDTIICWLTGYDQQALRQQIDKNVDLETFFNLAPQINKNASKITGIICGIRVEEIEDKLMQKIRYLDKLIDELAKGRPMEKILRK